MIAQNLKKVRENIESSCKHSGRNLSDVTLICVSKKQPLDKIKEAISLNENDFGENFIESIVERKEQFPSKKWHLIGPIQSKKINKIIGVSTLIHSIDRIRIARSLNEKLEIGGKTQDILLQMNLSGEPSKSGFGMSEIFEVIDEILKMSSLRLRGLMTLPPFSNDPERSRDYFVELRRLLERIRDQKGLGEEFCELSMGTTQDYCVAIEEGATLVRVGTAIFGSREG